MWSIFLNSISVFFVGLIFLSVSFYMFKYKFKETINKFICLFFLIVGCIMVSAFNFQENKQAIRVYNILLDENTVNKISSITIVPFKDTRFCETINQQKIVIKKESEIEIISKELIKIKSINPNMSTIKTIKLNIELNNGNLIVLSVMKISHYDLYLIDILINDKVRGRYSSENIWEILYEITKNDFFSNI